MNKLLKCLFKLNLYFCAGILIVDSYAKICDIHSMIQDNLSK